MDVLNELQIHMHQKLLMIGYYQWWMQQKKITNDVLNNKSEFRIQFEYQNKLYHVSLVCSNTYT